MSGIVLMVIALAVLGGGYLFYGKFLAKKWGIDPKAKTPAYEFEDGVDYVPADRGVVFGHQFASIAGAGPINGPIQAAVFGWVPVFLWVLIGSVFFGAVQDFASMYASVRNKGRTIGAIIEEYIGSAGKKLFLAFCWLFCILVVAAFADVVAGTFNGTVADPVNASANGSVATTSMIFIAFAVILGFILRKGKLNKWINTAIAITFLVVAIAIGLQAPVFMPASTWHIIVFIYILIASIVPIWALLQPRDYLNSYLLVAMIIAAVVGIFASNPAINLPAFTQFNVGAGKGLAGLNSLFPFMFVTIACGAISGFHSLVSSGTASKQIKNERDMLPISYGAMLLEGLLAVVALIAVASFAKGATAGMTPPTVFARGVANFLTKLGLPSEVVFTLINLSVSAFALTSLDSVARVGRLSFQEFFQSSSGKTGNSPVIKFFTNKYVATVATLLVAYFLAKAGYAAIWPLFGSSNQLLAVLALMACAVFFKKTRRLYAVCVVPALFMTAVTFVALVIKIMQLGSDITKAGNALQLVFAVLVFGLGICIVYQCLSTLAKKVKK
jgi:carbon starvation protein